ncbi:MAG: flagellar motor switch protein FliM [Natronohydrobacter sp.]|nr:flagellar motor switch protein FliM [Natronohydrobacter sp.]
MAKQRKLSATEVAALVGGLSDDLGTSDAVELVNGKPVRPFSFATTLDSSIGEYHGLRIIHERFCRIARTAFLPMLRFQPRLSSFLPELMTFEEYRNGQENFLSLTISASEELRGNQLMVLPPSFVRLLTNAYYGGGVAVPKVQRTEFTATEHRVIELITDRLNAALQLAWRDIFPVSFSATSRDENMQFLAFAENQEKIVSCSFMVEIPGHEAASFDILYPLQMFKPIAGVLRSRMQSDQLTEDRSWREKLEAAVLNIPLTISARLCQPQVSVARLLRLEDADVIPVSLGPSVDLLIEGVPLLSAQPGEQGGKSAVAILRPLGGAGFPKGQSNE